MAQMVTNFGPNHLIWPEVGCGSRFIPHAKGASLVVELNSKDGAWHAFLSERIPPKLDNRIKGTTPSSTRPRST